MSLRMAFDRSLRTVDQDGRLHVALTNISKATVSPYMGSEIPKCEELGLDPGKIYMLLRDPEELRKGAATFNNIPLLSTHTPVHSTDHQPQLVVGSTGTDAVWNAPYLQNSIVIWESVAIAGVDTKQQCEISCAYRYDADMTPGVYDGVEFDGVMRNLIGNHVALVEVGRAGPDVVVADANPFYGVTEMKKLTRTALAVHAALGAVLRPKLAADAALPNMHALLKDVTKDNLKPKALSASVLALVKPKLAADMELTPAELADVVECATQGVTDDPAMDGDETDEEREAREKAAKDALPDPSDKTPPKVTDKPAMDAAIAKATSEGETRAVARMNAIRQAERDVAPFVGEVVAMDSAEKIYKFALDAQNVDTEGMEPSAYRHVLKNLAKPGAAIATKPALAADSAGMDDFRKAFPDAVAPGRSF